MTCQIDCQWSTTRKVFPCAIQGNQTTASWHKSWGKVEFLKPLSISIDFLTAAENLNEWHRLCHLTLSQSILDSPSSGVPLIATIHWGWWSWRILEWDSNWQRLGFKRSRIFPLPVNLTNEHWFYLWLPRWRAHRAEPFHHDCSQSPLLVAHQRPRCCHLCIFPAPIWHPDTWMQPEGSSQFQELLEIG